MRLFDASREKPGGQAMEEFEGRFLFNSLVGFGLALAIGFLFVWLR